MKETSQGTYVVSREEELFALLHPRYGFHLLGQFREACTASEAARRLGDPASKVSYHVGRLQELGLLEPVAGAGGRGQPLQAVAQRFVLTPQLFPLLNNETVRPMLEALLESFLAAGEVPEPDPAREYVLMDWHAEAAEESSLPAHDWATQRRGVQVQQFHLTRERYAALMTDLQTRIEQEIRASRGKPEGKWHTVALLGFPGTLLPLVEREETKRQ